MKRFCVVVFPITILLALLSLFSVTAYAVMDESNTSLNHLYAQTENTSASIAYNDFAKELSQSAQLNKQLEEISKLRLYNNARDLLDYSFYVKNVEGRICAYHLIKINLENYQKTVEKNANLFLSKLATDKLSDPYLYVGDMDANHAVQKNYKDLLDFKISDKLDFKISDSEKLFLANPNTRMDESIVRAKEAVYHRDMTAPLLLLGTDTATGYTFGAATPHFINAFEHMLSKRHSYYFTPYTEIFWGDEKKRFIGSSRKLSLCWSYVKYILEIRPEIYDGEKSHYERRSYPYLIYVQPLDIRPDKLNKVTDIKGGYELTRLERW